MSESRPSAEILRASFELQNLEKAAKAKAAAAAKKGDAPEVNELEKAIVITAHAVSAEELFENLGVNPEQGLTSAKVADLLEEFGPNKLQPPIEDPEWLKLLKTQTGLFNMLLWFGAILCFISYSLKEDRENLALGCVLAFVVVATGIFEYFQEKKSSDMMKSFADMAPPKCNVKRNGGKVTEIDAVDLVPGDILLVSTGNKLPADIRIIECTGDCTVDNASLTGEAEALKRSKNKTNDEWKETRNLAFFGTTMPSGSCTGVVFQTGQNTVMGRVQALATSTEHVETPISKEIKHFIFLVSGVAMFLGVSFFTLGCIKQNASSGTVDWTTQFVFMIGIIVANVPEGLLATVTVCLSLTAQRMATKMVLVKNLEAVETLGSTSCICSDKTGTLTKNEMTVQNIACDGMIYEYKYGSSGNSNDFARINFKTKGTKSGVVESVENREKDPDKKGTCFRIKFDDGFDAGLVEEKYGWIPRSMISIGGKQLGEAWEKSARGLEDVADPKVGDKVEVTFSPDSMNRIVRVCAVCNKTDFTADSKTLKMKDVRTNKTMRLKYQQMLGKENVKEGAKLPFRARLEQSEGAVIFPVNQWNDTKVNATEAAMIKWVQDKDLFCDDDKDAVKSLVAARLTEAKAALATAEKKNTPEEIDGAKIKLQSAQADFDAMENLRGEWDEKTKGPLNQTRDMVAIDYENSGAGVENYRKAYDIIKHENEEGSKAWEIIFNSKNKYQVSVHKQANSTDKKPLILMKGGSDVVLNRCSHAYHFGKVVPLTPELKQRYETLNEVLAQKGRRVLACCEKEVEGGKEIWTDFQTDPANFPLGNSEEVVAKAVADGLKAAEEEKDKAEAARQKALWEGHKKSSEKLIFLGFTALIDPPREAVPSAVLSCKSAGIKVVMVTGDHPKTAEAIAKKVNIITGIGATASDRRIMNKDAKGAEVFEGMTNLENPALAPAIVIPGSKFDAGDPKEKWDDFLSHEQIVFARTSPQQKLLIVKNFQERGEIVAVTGDGVNDAPALSKADIGIAMGIMGTEVSKEAADMILLDDNFASIVKGVEEGRLIFDNLKKSIAYTLSSNIPEIAPFLSFITVDIPLPLSTVLILCIDLGTDMVPAISMAWETAEADIMKRKPRDQNVDRLVTKKLICFAYLQIGIIQAMAGFYSYLVVLSDYGYMPHTLPGLGADDNWGKQQLFCQVKNGVFRNEDGEPWKLDGDFVPINPAEETTAWKTKKYDTESLINLAASEGFEYWDWRTDGATDAKQGEVVDCIHSAKAVNSAEGKSQTGNEYYDPSTAANYRNGSFTKTEFGNTLDNTASRPVVAVNHVFYLRKLKYINYIPFQGRMSSFYYSSWMTWDPLKQLTGVASVQGMGRSTADQYYSAQALGYRVIPGWAKTVAGTTSWAGRAANAYGGDKGWVFNAARKKDLGNDAYNEAALLMPESGMPAATPPKSCTCFTGDETKVTVTSEATCAKPEGAQADRYCMVDRSHTWKGSDDKVRTNVGNRMIQEEALKYAQTSGFTTIIVVQWADLMICKTRWLSIADQGMVNPLMNFGLLFETILGCLMCYFTPLGAALNTRPLRLTHWMPGMPFCIFIFLYDESRKRIMRKTEDKTLADDSTMKNIARWVKENTYY